MLQDSKIKELLKKGTTIYYLGEPLLYLEIFESFGSGFKYGLTPNGWLIEDNNDIFYLNYNNINYISFVKLLQLPFESIVTSIEHKCFVLRLDDIKLYDIFPIKEIIKTVFEMGSNYWSKLAVEFLIYIKLEDSEIREFLYGHKNSKWLSQPVKHIIKRYLNA